jgi:phosphoserine phosphatase RsbU/P
MKLERSHGASRYCARRCSRANLQQERLIKEQLRNLANSLDPASREEIIRALEGHNDPLKSPLNALSLTGRVATLVSARESDNQLASLASTLTRLSELITSQQSRLMALLRELQEAMEHKARLASLQQELEIARQMQLSILPRSAPETPAIEISSIMIPAKEVGGDFYDFFLLDDQRLAVVVADVSGKGVPAAFFMAISRTLLKNNAVFVSRPADVIALLNDQLAMDNDQMMFVTLFYGILDLRNGQFTYVNAGHNPPVHIRSNGEPELLPLTKAMALAVLEGQTFPEGQLTLAAGETLVFYTDGVTEATSLSEELYGEKRLLNVLKGRNGPGQAGVIPAEILQSIREFERGAAQADDITTVALTFVGGTPRIE